MNRTSPYLLTNLLHVVEGWDVPVNSLWLVYLTYDYHSPLSLSLLLLPSPLQFHSSPTPPSISIVLLWMRTKYESLKLRIKKRRVRLTPDFCQAVEALTVRGEFNLDFWSRSPRPTFSLYSSTHRQQTDTQGHPTPPTPPATPQPPPSRPSACYFPLLTFFSLFPSPFTPAVRLFKTISACVQSFVENFLVQSPSLSVSRSFQKAGNWRVKG